MKKYHLTVICASGNMTLVVIAKDFITKDGTIVFLGKNPDGVSAFTPMPILAVYPINCTIISHIESCG